MNKYTITHTYIYIMLFLIAFYGVFASIESQMALAIIANPDALTASAAETAMKFMEILPGLMSSPVCVVSLCILLLIPSAYSIPYIRDMAKEKTGKVPVDTTSLYFGLLYVIVTIVFGIGIGLVISTTAAISTLEPTQLVSYSGMAFAVCGAITFIINSVVVCIYVSFSEKRLIKLMNKFMEEL